MCEAAATRQRRSDWHVCYERRVCRVGEDITPLLDIQTSSGPATELQSLLTAAFGTATTVARMSDQGQTPGLGATRYYPPNVAIAERTCCFAGEGGQCCESGNAGSQLTPTNPSGDCVKSFVEAFPLSRMSNSAHRLAHRKGPRAARLLQTEPQPSSNLSSVNHTGTQVTDYSKDIGNTLSKDMGVTLLGEEVIDALARCCCERAETAVW